MQAASSSEPGQAGGQGHAHGAQLGRAEEPEDPHRVEDDVQGKGQHVHYGADDHPVDAPQYRQIDLNHAPAEVGHAHAAEVGRADGNELRVVGEQQHHGLRHQQRRRREGRCDGDGEAHGDALHHLDGPHVPLAVVLGAEDGDAGAQAVEDHEQHAGVLGGQGDRRDGGLSHIVEHHHVGGADGGAQQVLDDDGQNQLENLAVKIVFAQTSRFSILPSSVFL